MPASQPSISGHNKDTRIIKGIKEISHKYDAFLIDQWGVLHNGHAPHPKAMEALKFLKQQGKPVVLISNSSRPPKVSEELLKTLGYPRESYDAAVTSGGLTREYLASTASQFGKYVKVFDDSGEPSALLQDLDFEAVESVEQANFILMARAEADSLDDYMADLQHGIKAKLPMICGNPDKVSVSLDGSLHICPGAVAEAYSKMGGEVVIFGKPAYPIYEQALKFVADNLQKPLSLDKVLAIGDSLEHDIDGGNMAGCGTLLIASGIHKDALLPLNDSSLQAFRKNHAVSADYVCDLFCV